MKWFWICVLLTVQGFSGVGPVTFYKGWTDLEIAGAELKLRGRPVDCNMVQFWLITPYRDGALLCEFEVPLIDFDSGSDTVWETNVIKARSAKFFVNGTLSDFGRIPRVLLPDSASPLRLLITDDVPIILDNLHLLDERSTSSSTLKTIFGAVHVRNAKTPDADPFEILLRYCGKVLPP
jgi:hypothetical protein